jgi:hypothetical protein
LNRALASFHKNYPAKDGRDDGRMKSEAEALILARDYQEIESGFMDLF